MEVKKIFVVGAGTMGSGIAQISATSGYKVYMYDIAEQFVQRGYDKIKSNIEKMASKGKITEEAAASAIANLSTTLSLEDAKDADLVIEAAVEDEVKKAEIFKQLDAICKPEAILASNTSSIPITQIGAATKRPGQVVGMHFFNPAPVMKLVEIIRGHKTVDAAVAAVKAVSDKMGKVSVVCKDSPGFIVNRLFDPMLNEAAFLLFENVSTVEEIDLAVVNGLNHPMGPLKLADMIGLDVILAVTEVLYRQFNDPKYRPCPLLKTMVRAGELGVKTKKGFYTYE